MTDQLSFIKSRDVILNKMKLKESPNDKEKMQLSNIISKLSKQDHKQIFNILQSLPNKIYTTNEKETLFDINDIQPYDFWRIYDISIMLYENNNRNNIIKNSKIEAEELNNNNNLLLFSGDTRSSNHHA
jgi:hypothetical protein